MNKPAQYSPKKAYEMMQEDEKIVLIDVRSRAENEFVGRPLDCVFAAWLEAPDWQPKPEAFVKTIKDLIGANGTDSEIILICRSGYRSDAAGRCLLDAGFTNVAHICTGFEGDLDENNQRGKLNGWRFDGLPWEQN